MCMWHALNAESHEVKAINQVGAMSASQGTLPPQSSYLAVSHFEVSSKLCDRSQSDCLYGNDNIAHGNLPKVTRPFLPRV